MIIHKALHPRDNVDRLYVSRKEGGRGLASIEDSVDASIQWLKDYIEKYEGELITAIRNNTDNMIDNRMTITRKRKLEEKQFYGNFKLLINNICPWCNSYRRRKWTRWHEFKSWMRPIAFHKALIPLGKVWIQLFSLQLWVNSRAD